MKLVELTTAVGVAAVDNVLAELEERGKITGKATYINDGLRIGAGLGGIAYDALVGGSDVARTLGIAYLPLAVHSIRKIIKKKPIGFTGTLVPFEIPPAPVPVESPTPTAVVRSL